jgi:opacity protein-like surface antigen
VRRQRYPAIFRFVRLPQQYAVWITVPRANLSFPLVGYQATSSATHTGWIGGGGIEYAFTNALSAKVEGLYYDMGSETIAFTSPLTKFTETSSFNYKGALVRLGANLKFGP